MKRLRQFLAFPMYAAAAWLVWVLAQQAGPDGVLLALGGGVLVALAAWALGVAQEADGRGWGGSAPRRPCWRRWRCCRSSPRPRRRPDRGRKHGPPHAWRSCRRRAGPVFVNLTAAWCISCKVNEALVLDTAPVRQFLAARNVAMLTGDWTSGDAAITALLRQHGRDGVPLYLLFPAGDGPPQLLPQILTLGILRDALDGL
jgi:thiol:disulfide interchange protein DsbD